MSKPLVSIITPTYNHEKFIGQCIESVLAQTSPNWEMIIVDDGSQDGTSDVIARYNDPRIRYFRQEHKGIRKLHETYNFALEQAQGDLVAILEGDDCWPKERLEIQIPIFRDRKVVLCFGRFRIIAPDGHFLDRASRASYKVYVLNRPPGIAIRDMILRRLAILPTTVTIKRDALEHIGGFHQPPNIERAVDTPTWLHLVWEGEFRYIDAPLGYWRRHPNQVTASCLTVQEAEAWAHFIAEYLSNLPDDKRAIVALDARKVFQWFKAHNYFLMGRHHVLRGDRKGAVHYFLIALRIGRLRTRVGAMLGIVAAATKHDLIERVAQLFGKPPILIK